MFPTSGWTVWPNLFKPQRVVPTTFQFVDIAGLVKGASRGEGLGNKFLAHIREVDAIIHVVRCFEDENITHVDGKVDPEGDIETINLELVLADLESVERRLERTSHQKKSGDKEIARARSPAQAAGRSRRRNPRPADRIERGRAGTGSPSQSADVQKSALCRQRG